MSHKTPAKFPQFGGGKFATMEIMTSENYLIGSINTHSLTLKQTQMIILQQG